MTGLAHSGHQIQHVSFFASAALLASTLFFLSCIVPLFVAGEVYLAGVAVAVVAAVAAGDLSVFFTAGFPVVPDETTSAIEGASLSADLARAFCDGFGPVAFFAGTFFLATARVAFYLGLYPSFRQTLLFSCLVTWLACP